MAFLSLNMHPGTTSYMREHRYVGREEGGDVEEWNTVRNTTDMARQWLEALSWEEVGRIEQDCLGAMRAWGYQRITRAQWERREELRYTFQDEKSTSDRRP